MTLAATLAVALVLTALWSMNLKNERDRLVRLEGGAAGRLANLERENRQLRSQTENLGKALASWHAQLGFPIFDVFRANPCSARQVGQCHV